jgi:pimeloyl-ACP methyl ester carboxylesterase
VTAEAERTRGRGLDHFATVDGHRFHYVEWGDPRLPKLAMLHGAASSAHGTWDQTAPSFADAYHMVAIDQRGHGETDWDPESRYRVQQYAADTHAAYEQLGWRRFSVIAHSLGGMIAIGLAADHPDIVERLVLIDVAPRVPDPNAPPIRNRIAERPESFSTRAEAEAYARSTLPEDARDRPLDYGFIERDGAWTWRTDIAGLKRAWAQGDPTLQARLWEQLASLRCPTLVLRAGRPKNISDASVARVRETNARVRVVDYPNAGHWLHQAEPERFAREVTEFLTGA